MIPSHQLLGIPFLQGFPGHVIELLAQGADEQLFGAGELIVRQHDEASRIYLLLSGAVQFLIRFEGVGDLLVGTSRRSGVLIGWSAYRIPYRYTATVRCEEECRLICIQRSAVDALIRDYPEFGFQFLARVAATLADRLEQTRDLLIAPRGAEDTILGSGLA